MKRICLCLCLLLMIVACDDENDGGRYPDVLTSFADVITDKSGTIEKMNDGDGISYSVSNASGGYKKDTLYRVVAQYRLVDESSIYLYNTTKTISPVPVPSNHIKGGFKTDSVRMQGIWLSAGYIKGLARLTRFTSDKIQFLFPANIGLCLLDSITTVAKIPNITLTGHIFPFRLSSINLLTATRLVWA